MKKFKEAFHSHKADAKRRGIDFHFSFEGWLKVWKDSGHLHQRGHGKGRYVMARYGDKGPYALDNVEIILFEQNCRNRIVGVETKKKMSSWQIGKPKSEETKHKLSLANLGKKHTREARLKMSLSRRGKKRRSHTEETKARISQAKIGCAPTKGFSGRLSLPRIPIKNVPIPKSSTCALETITAMPAHQSYATRGRRICRCM